MTYDSGDRLGADAANTYTYDAEGDLVSKKAKSDGSTTTYTWTPEHQLVGISFPDGTTATYRYDPLGRLVEVDEGTSVTRYAFDQNNIAAEYDGTNTLTASYVQNPTTTNQPLEMTRGGARYFYLTDAQGSTTALTTPTGTVTASYTYGVFGAPTETGTLSNPFTYTGQLYDAKAGLLLFPRRGYDPAEGRFLSEDPQPSINPYPYVSNDPTNATDPTGAQALAEYTITFAKGCIAGVITGAAFDYLTHESVHLLEPCVIGGGIALFFASYAEFHEIEYGAKAFELFASTITHIMYDFFFYAFGGTKSE